MGFVQRTNLSLCVAQEMNFGQTYNSFADAFAAFGGRIEPEKSRQEIARDWRIAQNRKRNERKQRAKRQQIAILDFESDPFDNKTQTVIFPFLAVLYAPEFEPVIIWEEDYELFVDKVIATIEALPGKYTIYAHNGGKFDFMFLISRLRGKVSFKGRGIMLANIGNHQLRDSFHIIPEKLAALQKQKFDYETNLTKANRGKFRKEIIAYCLSDCENLYFYVARFLERYGFKISIGAASLSILRQHYEIERITETTDDYLRRYFFGGRVECLTGLGHYDHGQKLYDINSAYPDAMATIKHPVGAEYIIRPGEPNAMTCFLTIECRNRGALMSRGEDGSVGTRQPYGVFHTTIHEYDAALELGLISDVKVIECVDNFFRTDFREFITPIYAHRTENKHRLSEFRRGSIEWNECNTEVVFDKLIMNNAYGKTAQDPRRFKEHYLTDPGQIPDARDYKPGDAWELEFQSETYWIWVRPSADWRFLNVGTGASITGAVRAKLMRAIANAVNPVYCDTDSLICDALPNTRLDDYELGAWKLEHEISELIVCGKKLYAYRQTDGEIVVRSKGAVGLTWEEMQAIYAGGKVVSVNFGPTLTRRGEQHYIAREISATVKTLPGRTTVHA